ncbi:MAG: 2-hydroxychromene-2-carboxylate isomerase [Hyphomonadaceae bacterium]|nr:2-hydroxychromene-2-carboxylate isomerase [Hyphomonadaceae bacterium]
MARPLTFWFEFASPYSYLSAMRIDAVAEAAGVKVTWRPFLLGPIFKAQGWDTSPFSIYPAKGQNMWRDIERRAEKYAVPFKRPDLSRAGAFPQNSVLAARAAIACLSEPWGPEFCRRVFRAAFEKDLDISQPDVIADCVEAAGGVDRIYMHMAYSHTQKVALREHTDHAQRLGIYGAPSFTVDSELFWGDDRLEDALEWALRD